jgi:hypothetical protein
LQYYYYKYFQVGHEKRNELYVTVRRGKMGCGSSGNVIPVPEEAANGHSKPANGVKMNGRRDTEHDDLPTVVLPETPIKAKPREYFVLL